MYVCLFDIDGTLVSSSGAGRLLPGVGSLLQRLSAEPGVVLGLLTGNVPRGAEIKLSHCGVYHYFRFGAFGDRRQTRDEVAHDALARVQEHLGRPVPAGQVLVIGDTPADIRCARAIGGKAIAVATGIYSLENLAAEAPDLLLADFADPQPLLRCCRL
jgi:phosphoglycolate phosphatase-like HAD superfamily hydrolase